MNCYRRFSRLIATASFPMFLLTVLASPCQSHETDSPHLHFQKPGETGQTKNQTAKRPARVKKVAKAKQSRSKQTQNIEPVNFEEVAASSRKKSVTTKRSAAPVRIAKRNKQAARPDVHIGPASHGEVIYESGPVPEYGGYQEGCACEINGGVCEPGCGICEPGCGFADPGCGMIGPGCGMVEPGCGFTEPSCGAVGCGTCVGRPGPDYWCFPVCLPRFKDLSFWAGVHGFRGPRDFAPNPPGGAGRSDSNFGFQEGANISGRAPFIGLLFPQLSYQLGYQAVQSRLSGTVDSSADRNQQFVTAGFFRRVKTGLQFGVVWDLLRDDLDVEVDFHQIRSEVSLKSPRGREIGFFATSSTNSNQIDGIVYEAANQYALFFRWNHGKGYESRLWGGATDNSEGIFGGDFYAPLNDRWALQSGFNYLITDKNAGLNGVREEAWNIGINLVWHLGRTARRGCQSPFRPLFAVADNGWMIIDNTTPYP